MKPAQFEYHRPETVAETVELVEDLEGAELMAGNQSLGIMLSTRLATPDHVIDINRVEELAGIDVDENRARVGAMTRHRDIERSEALADAVPMLPLSAEQIAGPAVRNRGTFGGSVAEADPAGNYPCAMTALEGTFHLRSVDGEREVSADDFFIAHMFTEMRENEVIVAGSVDRSPWPTARTGMAFTELKRAAQTWPTVSAGAAIRVDDPGAEEPTVERARLALANAAGIPLRVEDAEGAVEGGPVDEGALESVGEATLDAAEPEDELHADAEFKREAAAEYARRAIRAAYERARA